jgi:predicted transport protein
MSSIKLFRLVEDDVEEISGTSMAVEKSLQTLVDRHLESFLGVRFLASEYVTTRSHGGRIDTLGIDETNSPVIVEYKRALNENVINQGLFYQSWLLDHKADFQLLVMKRLGHSAANSINWRYPRLVCIAGDFTKYDVHAIEQMPQNIDLIRYRKYGEDLILLEQVASSSNATGFNPGRPVSTQDRAEKTHSTASTPEQTAALDVQSLPQDLQNWFHSLQAFILELGDDIEERTLPKYVAFRRLKTFAYFSFQRTRNRIVIDVPLPPKTVPIEENFTQQVPRNYVRIFVDSDEDVERAQPIIALAYERS